MATKRNDWIESLLGGFGILVIFGLIVWSILPDQWTDPIKFSVEYSIDVDQVRSSDRPTDCDWMHAPLGGKGCHYKKSVIGFNAAGDVVVADDAMFGTDTKTGEPIASLDGGKTWVHKDAPESSGDRKVSSVQIKWIKVLD